MLTDKIVILNQNNVFSSITAFINDRGANSDNTKKAYETDIRQFFQMMRQKEVEHLKEADLIFQHKDILRYKEELSNLYNSNTTVNRKLSTIKNLFEFLKIDHQGIRTEVFQVGRLKEKVNSYGVLSLDEAQKMIEVAKELPSGTEKSLIIELATFTSIRLTALLSLTWKNIKNVDGFWIVSVYDKGEKLDEKPISNDLYTRLLVLKTDSYKIFTLTDKTCQRAIKQLCEKIGINDEERNITFHSLKKVGVNWIIDATGDITKGAQQGNHSNIQTTFKHYRSKRKDFGSMAGILMSNQVDLSPLEDMNKEELIQLIQSSSLSTKFDIAKRIKG